MIDVIVSRAPADKPGEDIIDPLITTVNVAISRGKSEIDDNSDLQPMTVQVTYRAGVVPGQMAEIHDAFQGATWRGKITEVRHIAQGVNVFTEIDMERPGV